MASSLFVPTAARADLAPLLRLRPDRIVFVELREPDEYLALSLTHHELDESFRARENTDESESTDHQPKGVSMKKLFRVFAMALVLFGAGQAKAGIPVIDAANLANSLQQVIAWGEQYAQMAQQYEQLVQQYNQAVTTYNSMSGIRGMADLVNNVALRRYLPNEWSQAMNLLDSPGGYTNLQSSINSIKGAVQIVGIEETNLDPNSAAGRAFVGRQNQAATNRALSEEGFKQASDRIEAIQTLIDKVNGVPDQKDVADLQARIQAEQAMVQNESVKLALMAQLQQAQRDIAAQQAREISMKSTKSATGVARF